MEGWLVSMLFPSWHFSSAWRLWIIFHYKSVARTKDGLSTGERAELEEMIEVANKMAARIETLEAILDVESPDWRENKKRA